MSFIEIKHDGIPKEFHLNTKGNERGFGVTVHLIRADDFQKMGRKLAHKETHADTTATSQPASIHAKRVLVEGKLVVDTLDSEEILKSTETQILTEIDPRTKELIKLVESKIGNVIWEPENAFWFWRTASTAIKQLRAGRVMKFLRPYSRKLWNTIRKMKNEVFLPNIEKYQKYLDYAVFAHDEIAKWSYQDYLDKRSAKAASKTSSPRFAKMLDRMFTMTEEEQLAINEWCEVLGAKKHDFNERRWTWKVVDLFLRWSSDDARGKPVRKSKRTDVMEWQPIFKINSARQEELWAIIAQWYSRAKVDCYNIVQAIKAYQAVKYPEKWDNWLILTIECHELLNVVMGIRDSCDVTKINHDDDLETIILETEENSQRIVGGTASSGATLYGLSELAKLCMDQTDKLYVGTGERWVNAQKHGIGGLDYGIFDALVGAVTGMPSYVKVKKTWSTQTIMLIAIGLVSGEMWTQVVDTQLSYDLLKYMGVLSAIIALLGDDIVTRIFPTIMILRLFYVTFDLLRRRKSNEKPHKMFGNLIPVEELLKPKQSSLLKITDISKLDDKQVHINFILGLYHVFIDMKHYFYGRAWKGLATKQSPEGSEKPKVGFKSGLDYIYEERRDDKPMLSELWDDQSWLYYGEDVSILDKILEPGIWEKLMISDDLPGAFDGIEDLF